MRCFFDFRVPAQAATTCSSRDTPCALFIVGLCGYWLSVFRRGFWERILGADFMCGFYVRIFGADFLARIFQLGVRILGADF